MTSIKTKLRQSVAAIFAAFSKSRFRRILAAIFAAFTIFLVNAPVAAQPFDNVWHVDEDAEGGNGLTWPTAFNNLQDALDEAEGTANQSDLIKVAQGLYIPTVRTNPADPRSVTFELNGSDFNDITIEGGYAGINEPGVLPDVRDVDLYVATLSGDIFDPYEGVCGEGNGGCFIDNGTRGCEDEACCATVCEVDPGCCEDVWDETCAQIAMVLCTGGEVPYGAYHVVTAIDVDDTVRIRGLTITAGSAGGFGADSRGGGVFINDATPALIRCVIAGNAAGAALGDGEGGGIHVMGASDVTIVNCTFRENFAAEGGAMHLDTGVVNGTLINCLFRDNNATDHGGAIDIGGDEPTVFDVINCTFVNNSVMAAGQGGAIHVEDSEQQGDPGPTVLITNGILWFNTSNQIHVNGGILTVRYSNVEGGVAMAWDGGGNIDVQPIFGPGIDNYRLEGDSRGVDEGNNADVPCDEFDVDGDGEDCGAPAQDTPDLDLRDRIVDGNEVPGADVDMGAYEFAQCPWDIDGNCSVGASDLLDLLFNWGPCVGCAADFDGDDIVGASDLLALLFHWGPCPCGLPIEPPTIEEEMAAHCLTMDDWDAFEDVMTDPNSSQEDKDNYLCWMIHYLDECSKCFCTGQANCPGPDPFN